jgi:hypothetical protein
MPSIVVAPFENMGLLRSSDIETKNAGCLSFLARQHGPTASLKHVLLSRHSFCTKFFSLLAHRPHESSVNIGLADNVEVMGKSSGHGACTK